MAFEKFIPKEEKKKPKSSLVKKLGLVLGFGTAVGLSGATLEGLKNKPQKEGVEALVEKKQERPEAYKSIDKEERAETARRRKIDQEKIDELRRFIARESKSGDELYPVGKDPYAVPDEDWLDEIKRASVEQRPEYEFAFVDEKDLQNKHAQDFFEKVLAEKYKAWSEKSVESGNVRFSVSSFDKEGSHRYLCHVSLDTDGRYTISGRDGKPWKTVNEPQLEEELDNLQKINEEGTKHDPFFSPFA